MPEPRNPNEEQGLRHELSAGQIAMVAVGGSIGTGLLLGSASAIGLAGPAVILSYLLAAFINFTVACALGELACAHPAAGSFGVYGDLYLNDWAGFLSRGGYWAAIAVSIGTELVASGIYMGLWFPSVPRIVWVAGFSVALLLINLIDVGEYGRFEFWFAMVKVVTIAAFIALGTLLLMNGHTAPQYVSQGGFFPQGFLAPLLAMTFAIYAFGGIEFVAVSSGEARSPNEIAKAMRITFAMLTFLYLGSMAVLVGVMPWNRAGASESPFVTVFRSVNIPGAAHLMNFVVLTAALSGANAALYVSSRMLFSMARSGWAPTRLGQLNKQGSPKLAVLISSYGIVVALVMEKYAPRNAFEFILRAAFFGMMLSWIVSLAAHISFRRRATPEQIQTLPLRSPLGGWGSILGFTVICAVILKGWYDSRVNLVSGVLYLLLLTTAWWMIKRSRR